METPIQSDPEAAKSLSPGESDPEAAKRLSVAVLAAVAGFVLGGCAVAIAVLWTSQ